MDGNLPGVAGWTWLRKWRHEDAAVTSIEYALVAALIAVIIIGSVSAVGSELKDTYTYVANCVKYLSCQ